MHGDYLPGHGHARRQETFRQTDQAGGRASVQETQKERLRDKINRILVRRGRAEEAPEHKVKEKSSIQPTSVQRFQDSQGESSVQIRRGRSEQVNDAPHREPWRDVSSYTPQQLEDIELRRQEIIHGLQSIAPLWQQIQELHQEERYAEMLPLSKTLTDRFVTDKGNPIQLRFYGELSTWEQELTQKVAQSHLAQDGLADKVQQIGRPGPEYDCHGFTFAGGSGWLSNSHEIQQILTDNQYQVTTDPAPGDIIIYRKSATSEITHSGLVSRVELSSDGTTRATEIVSKWGLDPLYRHAPDDVPALYGEKWQIYCSNRFGSLLIPSTIAEQRINPTRSERRADSE